MSLIECSECYGQISDQAIACPHCGFPLNKRAASQKYVNQTQNSNNLGPLWSKFWIRWPIKFFLICVFGTIAGFFKFLGNANLEKTGDIGPYYALYGIFLVLTAITLFWPYKKSDNSNHSITQQFHIIRKATAPKQAGLSIEEGGSLAGYFDRQHGKALTAEETQKLKPIFDEIFGKFEIKLTVGTTPNETHIVDLIAEANHYDDIYTKKGSASHVGNTIFRELKRRSDIAGVTVQFLEI